MRGLSGFRDLPPALQQELLNGPAMMPPIGTVPNFTNPPNYDHLRFGIIIATLVVATLLIALRTYLRICYSRKIVIEDVTAIAALGFFAAFHYFTWQISASPGLFVHQWNVRFKDMPKLLYHIIVADILYGFVTMMLKISILLHWTKVFAPAPLHKGFRWTCYVTIGVNILFYLIFTFIETFGCAPRTKLWDVTVEGKCMDVPIITITAAFINFFSDCIILLLPQPVIWKLQMSTSKKIGVTALFAGGIFAVACAGNRIKSTFDFVYTEDVTYAVSALGLWCIAELTAGFLVLCLPVLPQLYKNMPWLQKLIARFKSSLKPSSMVSDSSTEGKAFISWPRNKQMRNTDADLFTDGSRVDSCTEVELA